MQHILARLHDEVPTASSDLGDGYRIYRAEAHAAFEANRELVGSSSKPKIRRVRLGHNLHAPGYIHPDR